MLLFHLKMFYMLYTKFEPLCAAFFPEVMKGLWEKKQAKMKRNLSDSAQKPNLMKERTDKSTRRSEPEDNQVNLNQSLVYTVSTSLVVYDDQIFKNMTSLSRVVPDVIFLPIVNHYFIKQYLFYE